MEDQFNLKRFIDAQFSTYERALDEIKNGRKTSHWMWFIFPQYHGLGRSNTSIKYAINSKEEAISYLKHPILGPRLTEITKEFLSIELKEKIASLSSIIIPQQYSTGSSVNLKGSV